MTRPNMVNVRVGTGGRVCGYTLGETDLIVDLTGEYQAGAGARYASVMPQRLLDSRLDGHPFHQSNLAEVVAFGSVTAAQVNITVTEPVRPGYSDGVCMHVPRVACVEQRKLLCSR